MFKAKEDVYINAFVDEMGTCYLADGTCLHQDRDFSVYIIGGVISLALIILGIYLLLFDKTQKVLEEHQVKVSSALKEATKKESSTEKEESPKAAPAKKNKAEKKAPAKKEAKKKKE